MDEMQSLRARAFRLLAKRDYSAAELAKKLQTPPKKTSAKTPTPTPPTPALIHALIEQLRQDNYLNDARFAQNFSQQNASRHGARRIAQSLKQRGIDAEQIRAALQDLPDECARAQELWRKKFHAPPKNPKDFAKQSRFLAARGFSFDIIGRVLALAQKQDGES